MLMWLFTRLSALAMYALILFAIIGALVMGARNQMNFADVMRWGFMPNSTHLQSVDWKPRSVVNLLLAVGGDALLLVAVAHGVHGLVVIADDYIVSPHGRGIVRLISIVFMLSMSGLACISSGLHRQDRIMSIHQFDVIVIGAGGAGLMAGLYASRTAKTAVISKLYPTRSHTGRGTGWRRRVPWQQRRRQS